MLIRQQAFKVNLGPIQMHGFSGGLKFNWSVRSCVTPGHMASPYDDRSTRWNLITNASH